MASAEETSWTLWQRLKRNFTKSCRELRGADVNCFHADQMGYIWLRFEPIMIAAEKVPEECRCSCLKEGNECFNHRHYVDYFDETETGTKSRVYFLDNWEADAVKKTAGDKEIGKERAINKTKIQDEKMKRQGKWLLYFRERDGGNGGIARYGLIGNYDVVGKMLLKRGKMLINAGSFGAMELLTVMGMFRAARTATK